MLLGVLVALLATTLFRLLLGRDSVVRKIIRPTTPGSLAVIRLAVCGILLLNVLWEDLPSSALLPEEFLIPKGIIGTLLLGAPRLQALLREPAVLTALQYGTLAVLIAGLCGYRVRLSLPVAFVLYLCLGGILRQYCHFFHTMMVPLYVLGVLCLTPCADAWSVDRLRRFRKGIPVPPLATRSYLYGWACYLCLMPIALTYFSAGVSKLAHGGFFWWDPTNLKGIMLSDSLNAMQPRLV
jgi:hypothetical protein